MRNENTSNMDLDDNNSSFDSEAEDLEMRMYSELYFEPNPDYVPLQSTNDQGSIVQSECIVQAISPVCDMENSTDLLSGHKGTRPMSSRNVLSSNNNYVREKLSSPVKDKSTGTVKTNSKETQVASNLKARQLENGDCQSETGPKRTRRARLLSNSSSIQSIPGSVVLDQLYCCSNSPIIEESDDSVDKTEIDVTNWIESNKCIAPQPVPCNKKPTTVSQGRQPIKQFDDIIVIDDSSDANNCEYTSSSRPNKLSETKNKRIQIPTGQKLQNRLKNKSQKEHPIVSTPFKHEAQTQSAKRQDTLLDVIRKLKNNRNTAVMTNKNDTPCSKKKIDRKKISRAVTQFTADLSGESDPEITGFGNNGTLLTNLSINRSESLRNSAVERVYGITPGEEQEEELEPRKKRCKKTRKTRTHWPTDFTTDKSLRDRVPPLPHWTPHMTAFYETDFSDEFDLEDIHKRMPSSVIEWDLDEDDLPYSVLRRQQSDRRATPRQRQRYFRGNDRCERCKSFDHSTAECTKLEHCHLCGNTGHSSREGCPSNTCLRCGEGVHTFCQKATLWSKCDLCNRKGHIQDLCPDVWRRFCFTTSGRTPVTPSNDPSSSVASDRLSCFSCGRTGHLGPDCQHRVPNYVVLSFDVMSFDPPTDNLLGKTILRPVDCPAWDAEEEVQVCSQYGEDVTVHTPSRASVLLRPGSAGLVIGKGGVVINTLQRVSGCTLSVSSNNRGQDELWVSGENIDPVIRAVLFYFLKVGTNIDGLDVYSSALEAATGHGLYDKAYCREVARLRAEYSRQKLHEKHEQQALNKKNSKKAKKALTKKAKSEEVVRKTNGSAMTNGCTADSSDVVWVSESDDSSDESDIQVIDRTDRQTTPSKGNLSIQKKASDSYTTPLGKNNTSKRLADEIKRSAKKLKGMNGNLKSDGDESSDAWIDSKSVFIDKILSRKKIKNNLSMEEQLTNSENSDGSSDSSDLDSAMEDYADNCIMGSDSDMSSEDNDGDSTDDSDDSDEDSLDDEESGSDTDSEGPYDLVLNDKMLTALMHKKLARNKTLIQMLPEGRISLIATLKGKLAELYNLHVDVKSTLEQLKRDCAEHNRTRSPGSLWSLQEGVKLLATYVLGTNRRGHGRALVKSLMLKLATLEASKEKRIAIGEREEIANTLQGLFEVDESSVSTIVKYALTLIKRKGRGGGNRVRRAGEPVFESTPKQPQRGRDELTPLRAAPANSRRYSSFTEDRSAITTRKKNKNNSLIGRLRYPSTFNSLDEIEQFNDPGFLRKKKIGTFTKSPRSKKLNSSRERKSTKIRNSFDGRLEFPSPVGGRPQTARRSSSKSPRTFKSKSPKRYFDKSTNTSSKSARGKTSKSPRMKRNQSFEGRAQSRGKASKSLRTKSKSPRRRK